MNIGHCDFRYENGKMKGLFCNRKIDIISSDGKSHSKCYRHISKKIYKPILKKDPNKLCISLNSKGELCGSYKTHGDYCIYHKHKLFDDEIQLFFNIDIDVNNDTIYQKYLKNYK